MKLNSKIATWGLLAALAVASVSPALADGWRDRSSTQNDKNNMRNLAIAGAAVAAYGLLNHNSTATLLGAAGAAVAGSQYEKDRQQQDNNHYYYSCDGRNGDNRDWNSVNRYGDGRWGNDDRYRSQGWAGDNRDNNRHWDTDNRSGDHDRDYERRGDRR